MKIYHSLLILGFSLFNLTSFSQSILQDSMIRSGKLSNGLAYYIRKNSSSQGLADFHLVQKVGSVLEEDSERGLAHFLEHMAFNGTKNFPGNTIISELEKKGIKFGRNINAYTGYDETVYKLTNIPVTRKSLLDTALLVLHDWSGFILNKDDDIESERAVVREEWRTRSSGFLRVQDTKVIPELLKGTAYANRLPIGSMDVVMNFQPKQLIEFYKKWYRPDLQGLVIVGDIDVDQVENKIKQLFGSIQLAIAPVQRPTFTIPDAKNSIIIVATDSEIKNASATVYWRQKSLTSSLKNSFQEFKIEIIDKLISNLINERLSSLKAKGSRNWNSLSFMNTYSVVKNVPAWSLEINAADSVIVKALKCDLLELERIRRFGFSKNELDPTIRTFYQIDNETEFFEKDQIQNFDLSAGMIKQFLDGSRLPDPTWKYQATQSILKNLTIDTLNFYVKKYLNSPNPAVSILLPEKAKSDVPTDSSIKEILHDMKSAKLKPYKKEVKPNEFDKLRIKNPGTIMSSLSNTEPFGFTKWVLSNGANVYFKNSGVKESKIRIHGFKIGGYSQSSLNDLPAAMAYNAVMRFASGPEGALGLIYRDELRNYSSHIVSVGPISQLNLFFKNIFLRMSMLKNEPQSLVNWKNNQLDKIKSKGILPKDAFGDTLRAIMSNGHPRAISLMDENIVKQISYRQIQRIHADYFENAKDYNFVITGYVNIDTVKMLVEKWLGGIPFNANSAAKIVDHKIYPPTGLIKKQFRREMKIPQSTITIGFTGEIPYTLENSELFSVVTNILKRRYTKEIREKEGGSYGVGVFSEMNNLPKGRFTFQVNFDSAPDSIKRTRLINIIYQEIEKLRFKGPDVGELESSLLTDLKDENQIENKQNGEYWYNKQNSFLLYGPDFSRSLISIIKQVDTNKVRNFANQIFGQGNLIEVIMNPL